MEFPWILSVGRPVVHSSQSCLHLEPQGTNILQSFYTSLQKKRNTWFCGIPDLKIESTSLRGQNDSNLRGLSILTPFRCHGVIDPIFWAQGVPTPRVAFLLEGSAFERVNGTDREIFRFPPSLISLNYFRYIPYCP